MVKPGKFLIYSCWHPNTDHETIGKELELVGVVTDEKLDREKLEDYLKEVDSDEEFKKTAPNNFKEAQELMKKNNKDPNKDVLKYLKEVGTKELGPVFKIPNKKEGQYYVFRRKAGKKKK
jgi:hypothetical protein